MSSDRRSESCESLTSILDRLSTYTAVPFDWTEVQGLGEGAVTLSSPVHEPPVSPILYVSLAVNDHEITPECSVAGSNPSGVIETWRWPTAVGDIVLVARLGIVEGSRVLLLGAESASNDSAEWSITSQMRVRAGSDLLALLRVVDRDVFTFERFHRPVSFTLSPDVIIVKFELRTINEFYRRHPTFEDGDVTIRFVDGSTLRTWKALLAWASPYMALKMDEASGDDIVDVSPFARGPFIEMLFQLYPTEKPLWSSFEPLSLAATSFDARLIVSKMCEHVVNRRQLPFHRRLVDAASMHLHDAVASMVEEAAGNGTWESLLRSGFDPVRELGPKVVFSVVRPALARVLKPKPRKHSEDVGAALAASIMDPTSSPWTATIIFLDTPFNVNKGVLAAHGGSDLPSDSNGRLLLRLSPSTSRELGSSCVRLSVSPGEVLLHILCSLYPWGPPVPSRLLFPAITLAAAMRLQYAIENMEQALISEPITTAEQLVSLLRLSVLHGLSNLRRTIAMRAEGSCLEIMREVVLHEGFRCLPLEVKQPVIDRMCSGWAHGWPMLAYRVTTDALDRTLTSTMGGPPAPTSDCATFRSMYSEAVFKEEEAEETVCA